MATYYVRKTGDDGNDGLSLAAAKLTIGNAVAAASAGDTIDVGPGTFAESVSLVETHLAGAGRDATIIEASNTGTTGLVSLRDGASISSCSVVNTSAAAGFGMKMGEACQVRGCYVFGHLDGIFVGDTSNYIINTTAEIRECEIESASDAVATGWDFVEGFGGDGVLTIRNSTLRTLPHGNAVTLSAALAVYTGRVVVQNCNIEQGNDQTTGADEAGVFVQGGGFGITHREVELIDCRVTGVVHDLRNDGTGTLAVRRAHYDATKVSGDVDVFEAAPETEGAETMTRPIDVEADKQALDAAGMFSDTELNGFNELRHNLAELLRREGRLPVFAETERPAPGIAGRMIFNSTTNLVNVDMGIAWTLVDGTSEEE